MDSTVASSTFQFIEKKVAHTQGSMASMSSGGRATTWHLFYKLVAARFVHMRAFFRHKLEQEFIFNSVVFGCY